MKCPYCAEEIKDAAILCRFCGKSLNEREIKFSSNNFLDSNNSQISRSDISPKRSKPNKSKVLIAIGVLVIAIFGFVIISNSSSSTSNNETESSSSSYQDEKDWFEQYQKYTECFDLALAQNYPNPEQECASLKP